MNNINEYYLSKIDVKISNEIKIRRKRRETFQTKKKV
tara:strand:+ start:274 stop:384 length:111 start_codon:yes stop_codon:yes gene_type:complete